ncbi:aminopeptidase [Azohydromonas caseinilytica]|uniref:Aminopeptidase n=1 Tax=Azohydromonas caseinilytica TaxID=2728836 RepID=A0A848F540_9BURK|nr:aminopeptidase [Azohydromonas caseinilytica]NML13420.1 aminopeptidase [Azohydromonas caseinilytica]
MRAGLRSLLLASLLPVLGGCSSVGYYAQSLHGHFDLLARARPVKDWVRDEHTPVALRERLRLSQEMREFAVTELKLPDNASYRRYADLQRDAAVWNVVAAPELSLQLKTWCFPVLGCVGYRGYFERTQAQALGDELKGAGWEVLVYGVPAYSTLGWSNWLGGDPLLNTFALGPETELARLLFHELAHQKAYADDDTAFNESYATAVERLGLERWMQQRGNPRLREEHEAIEARRAQFRALTRGLRERLDALYRGDAPDEEKRSRKAALMAQFRDEYERVKRQEWGGYDGYDRWVARANNAALAVQGAYGDLVPAFIRLFERVGGDWERFHAEAKRLAEMSKAERRRALEGAGS